MLCIYNYSVYYCYVIVINPVLFAARTAPVVKETKKNGPRFPDRLLKLMREMFGPQNANWSKEREDLIEVTVDSCTALLDPHTLVSDTAHTHSCRIVCMGGNFDHW